MFVRGALVLLCGLRESRALVGVEQELAGVRHAGAVGGERARDRLAGVRVADVAQGVDGTHGAAHEVCGAEHALADPGLHGAPGPCELADGAARAGADAAALEGDALGGEGAPGRLGALADAGTGGEVADGQVEEAGRGDDGYDARTDVEADPLALELLGDAAGGREAVGAAAREHHGVEHLHRLLRTQEVRLAGGGRAAAHVDASRRPLGADDHGAAGAPLGEGGVSGEDAGDLGDARGCGLWHGCRLSDARAGNCGLETGLGAVRGGRHGWGGRVRPQRVLGSPGLRESSSKSRSFSAPPRERRRASSSLTRRATGRPTTLLQSPSMPATKRPPAPWMP